jgi:transcriptional regulator with XRE-family HTH domain
MARAFGRRLKLARLRKKYRSAAEFARELGLEEETYRYYERGQSEPSLFMLGQIALKLQVSLDYLILDDLPPPGASGHAKRTYSAV